MFVFKQKREFSGVIALLSRLLWPIMLRFICWTVTFRGAIAKTLLRALDWTFPVLWVSNMNIVVFASLGCSEQCIRCFSRCQSVEHECFSRCQFVLHPAGCSAHYWTFDALSNMNVVVVPLRFIDPRVAPWNVLDVSCVATVKHECRILHPIGGSAPRTGRFMCYKKVCTKKW